MLPLSPQFYQILALSGFFVFSAVFIQLARRHWLFGAVPLIGFAGIVVWYLGVGRGIDIGVFYHLLVLAIFAAVMVAALIWQHLAGALADRIGGAVLWRSVLLIIPAILAVGWAFQAQHSPAGTCANERISFTINDAQFQVPPEFGARIDLPMDHAGRSRVLNYSNEPGDKEDKRELCRLAEAGSQNVAVNLLWLTPNRIVSGCDAADDHLARFCTDLPVSSFEAIHYVKIATGPEETGNQHDRWLAQPDAANLLTDGDSSKGFICHGDESRGHPIICEIWRGVDGGAYIELRSWQIENTTRQDVRDQLELALDRILKTTRP